MSQVINEPFQSSIADELRFITDVVDIVLLEGTRRVEVFERTVFPRETHYNKSRETVYEKTVHAHKVIDVLQSGSLQAGDEIWLLGEDAYDEHELRSYHEIGRLGSPVVLERISQYPITDNRSIMALNCIETKQEKFPKVYSIRFTEGEAAAGEILEVLQQKNGV